MKRLIFGELGLAAAVVLSGCASWRGYGHDHAHSSWQRHEFTLNTTTAASLDYQPASHTRWDFVASGNFTASPAVFDNTVYIGSLNGVFYAIWASGPSAGTVRWQYPPATPPSPPDACGTTTAPLLIAFGSGNPSGPGIASSAAIAEDVAHHEWAVIFGAPDPNSNQGDGRLWALDAKGGQCIWKSDVIAPTSSTSKIGYSSPAISHGRAYVGLSAKQPDAPITIGRVFAVDLASGAVDATFGSAGGVVSSDPPAGGGVWSSPAVAPDRSVIITTGNSCHWSDPDCSNSLPVLDRTLSMVKLDPGNGNPIWQVQPVDIHWDFDPDWAASPTVGRASCGELSLAVQKDGYLHAVDVGGMTPTSDPACSYPGHQLKCPRWTFPSVASLPFQEDGHGDNMDVFGNRLIHPGALAGDDYFVATGGLDVAANPPTPWHMRYLVTARLYKLDVCTDDAHRIDWILDQSSSSPPQAFGSPSFANGVVYVGTSTGDFYAIDAHTSITHRAGVICSYPSIPAGSMCSAGGFQNVDVPIVVRHLNLSGSIPGIPAVANGQVFVATTAGHLYALSP
jgi:outer membrane protein assembly factor BamB